VKKDYLKLFIKFARKHKIWFSVNADSCVGSMLISSLGEGSYSKNSMKFGSKAAYEWLLKTYNELNEDSERDEK
jgi:hypothetical protein